MKARLKNIFPHTYIIFNVMLILCLATSAAILFNQNHIERLSMETLIAEKSAHIDDTISKLFYRTQTLSSFIRQYNGDLDNFEDIAAILTDDPVILNVLVAPDGVVSHVYPLEGNEAVLGLDFFSEGAGNREAVIAKETGQLVLGGPFTAIQGGQILVGRLPVFFDEPGGEKTFWGIVSVTLKYPDALAGAHLSELQQRGFEYEVWRVSPDSGERQIIASSRNDSGIITDYVERQISFLNAEWYFRILTFQPWYAHPTLWILIIISVLLSLLLAAVTQNNQEVRRLKDKLEALSNADPLTGVYNRRYFMETVANQMIRVTRMKSESFILILDLDYFKSVNDKYGHQAGDIVLQETTIRTASVLRPYDVFARYGGEEFIIFVADINHEAVISLAERIRHSIEETEIQAGGFGISITASFGVAPAAPGNDLNHAIALADSALYQAKHEGRNRVCFKNI